MHRSTLYQSAETNSTLIKKSMNALEVKEIRHNINKLISETNSAYTASLPLMASAELGDKALYDTAITNMLRSLHNLDENPLPGDQWMQNNAFKAWMWGRILLAANSMNDQAHVSEAEKKLNGLLKEPQTKEDKPEFIAWARAYLAALNGETYQAERQKMLSESEHLSLTYSETKSPSDLSNALWAWVMDIQAAALNKDKDTYDIIKAEMIKIAGVSSVADALNQGLLRVGTSSDYPAWAMAKVLLSAVRMQDELLAASLSSALPSSIAEAKKANQAAEAILAELDFALANNLAASVEMEHSKIATFNQK